MAADTPTPLSAPPDGTGGWLRALHAQHAGGEFAAAAASRAALPPAQRDDPAARLAALALGGADFAGWLICGDRRTARDDTTTLALVQALDAVFNPPGAAPEHALHAARALAAHFGLPGQPQDLFPLLQAMLLIDRGPVPELRVAVDEAVRQSCWALALRGLDRLRQASGGRLPRRAAGLGAHCLHRLGRYEEAESWVHQGLGDSAALIRIPPVHDEAGLLRRWGAHDTPVVSILCTTYNHERYVESALRGFLCQDTEFPFEILIHDDASTDRTQEVIRRWHARYPRIIRPTLQTVNQLSRGVRPIETLLAQARGGFVATCEGDDFWIDPAKLQRQVAFLRDHPDVSCTTHNHYHLVEQALTVKPWRPARKDFAITAEELMRVRFLLWVPTLVFRKTFSVLPPERGLAAFGDQFLTSWLGTQGRGHYFETQLSAVRRENLFSTWSPLQEMEKERRRVQTWVALIRLHERLGHATAVQALHDKLDKSPLDAAAKAALLEAAPSTGAFPAPASTLLPRAA